jgi:hypothetical protein
MLISRIKTAAILLLLCALMVTVYFGCYRSGNKPELKIKVEHSGYIREPR